MSIADLPIFRELVPAECQRLAAICRERHLRTGERISWDQTQSGLLFVLSGELAIGHAGSSATIIDAPAVVGLLELLEGGPTGEVEARLDADLLVLDRAAFFQALGESSAVASGVARHLAKELRRLQGEVRGRLLGGTSDFFGSPGARLPAGPYATCADALVFVVRAPATRHPLPKGIRPIPGLADTFLMMFSFFDRVCVDSPDGKEIALACAIGSVLRPCLGPRLRPSLFCHELYVDSWTASTIARELYCLPGRYGRLVRGDRWLDLVVDDRLVSRASWRGIREADVANLVPRGLGGIVPAGPLASLVSGFVSRHFGIAKLRTQSKSWPRIPLLASKPTSSPTDPRSEASDIVVEVPLRVSELTSFAGLSGAKIEWFGSEYFARGECVGAFSYRQRIDLAQMNGPLADPEQP